MSEIKIVDEQGQIKEEPKEVSTPRETTPKEMPLENLAIAQALDMEIKEMDENKEGLGTLMKWVKTQTDDLSFMNIKWVVKNLEDRLGSPPLSEKRVSQLVRFATLDLQEKQIKKEKESLLSR